MQQISDLADVQQAPPIEAPPPPKIEAPPAPVIEIVERKADYEITPEDLNKLEKLIKAHES